MRKCGPIIGIFGKAGFNRGDDAITQSVIDGFAKEVPGARFIVAEARLDAVKKNDQVSAFLLRRRSPVGMLHLIWMIAMCDAVVLGGGSIIQDRLGGGRMLGVLGFTWTVSTWARFMSKSIVTAPVGVDALTTPKGWTAAREVLEHLGRITVRDAMSADVVREILGQSHPNYAIEIACDPAFALETEEVSLVDGRYYALAPAFEGRDEAQLVEFFAASATALLEADPAARIVLVAMDERQHEDAGKNGQIIDALAEPQRKRVEMACPRTAASAAALLRGSVGVVAMRLHAAILAYGFVPIYCLSRTTKTEALIHEFGISGCTLASINPQLAAGEIVRALAVVDVGAHATRRRSLQDQLATYYRDAARRLFGDDGWRDRAG